MPLVLSRGEFERVFIDGPCTITVIKARNGTARLAIEADKSVSITRPDAHRQTPRTTEVGPDPAP